MFGLLFGSIMHVFTSTALGQIISPMAPVAVLSEHQFSLQKRYENEFVSHVFEENILLTLAYWRGLVSEGKPVDWKAVNQPFHWEFTMLPDHTVSYHDLVLPKYQGKVKPLGSIHFNSMEGFLSDGYLVGDGTCHLASLISWVAKDAKLEVEAPTNHNFAAIPEVPKEQGVAIYSVPQSPGSSALQNLYITNNQTVPITFAFDYDGTNLRVSTLKFL